MTTSAPTEHTPTSDAQVFPPCLLTVGRTLLYTWQNRRVEAVTADGDETRDASLRAARDGLRAFVLGGGLGAASTPEGARELRRIAAAECARQGTTVEAVLAELDEWTASVLAGGPGGDAA